MVQGEIQGTNLRGAEQAWKVTYGLVGCRTNLIAIVLEKKAR